MIKSIVRRRAVAGYTLLELLLALSLSVVVIAAIGGAMQMYVIAPHQNSRR